MRYLQSLFHYIDLFIIHYLKCAVEDWQKARCSKQDQRFCFETLFSGEKCICCVELLRSVLFVYIQMLREENRYLCFTDYEMKAQ